MTHTGIAAPSPSPSADDAIENGGLLTPDEVREFQTLMREECGEDLDASAAYLRATELIRLFRQLMTDDRLADADESSDIGTSGLKSE